MRAKQQKRLFTFNANNEIAKVSQFNFYSLALAMISSALVAMDRHKTSLESLKHSICCYNNTNCNYVRIAGRKRLQCYRAIVSQQSHRQYVKLNFSWFFYFCTICDDFHQRFRNSCLAFFIFKQIKVCMHFEFPFS